VTPQLLAALRDVDRREVDHLSPYVGQGDYVWHCGGVVPAEEQDALREAFVLRLTVEIPAALDGKPGCAVRLSPAGEEVLSLWDAQSSPASGPVNSSFIGVQPGAGEPTQRGER